MHSRRRVNRRYIFIYFLGDRLPPPPPPPSYLAPGKTLSKASIIFQYGNFHPVNKVFNSYLHILTFNICFQVEVMMEGIIQAFLDRVSGVGWIDNQTVEAVREKVRITHFEKNSSITVMPPRSLILLASLQTLFSLYFHFLFSKGVGVRKSTI